jgi:hypothetical protein
MTEHQNFSAESALLKKIQYALTKDSLTNAERVESALCVVLREQEKASTRDPAQAAPVPGPLEAAIKLLIHASIGSCTCNTKSPELMWHAPDCRFARSCDLCKLHVDFSALKTYVA